jgi:putative ABC transport system substrate-binding protein
MIIPGLTLLVLVTIVLIILLLPKPKEKVVSVITFINHPVLNTIEQSFRERLEELVVSEQKVKIVTSNAQGRVENLPDISRQVFQQQPYLVLTISTPVTQALMREADPKQRIVYTFVTNPSDLGDELLRTNSTGLSDAVNYAANLELIKNIFGSNVKIGMLYNPNEANSVYGIQLVETLLKGSTARLIKSTVTREVDIPTATAQLATVVNVIYVGGDNTVVGAIPAVLKAAVEKNVPVFASDIGSIKAGAIAGVSVDYVKLGRMTAEVVNNVLNGTEPRTIPRITLSGDRLIVNKTAADRWNFKIPKSVLDRADEVIGGVKGD